MEALTESPLLRRHTAKLQPGRDRLQEHPLCSRRPASIKNPEAVARLRRNWGQDLRATRH